MSRGVKNFNFDTVLEQNLNSLMPFHKNIHQKFWLIKLNQIQPI